MMSQTNTRGVGKYIEFHSKEYENMGGFYLGDDLADGETR